MEADLNARRDTYVSAYNKAETEIDSIEKLITAHVEPAVANKAIDFINQKEDDAAIALLGNEDVTRYYIDEIRRQEVNREAIRNEIAKLNDLLHLTFKFKIESMYKELVPDTFESIDDIAFNAFDVNGDEVTKEVLTLRGCGLVMTFKHNGGKYTETARSGVYVVPVIDAIITVKGPDERFP